MSNIYEDIIKKNKSWEEQIPLLELLCDDINKELKQLKDESKKLEKEKSIISQEYTGEKQKKDIVTNEKNTLLKSIENLTNRLYNLANLLLTLTAASTFILTLIGGIYIGAFIYKCLILFSISKNLLTVLTTLGIILFDIAVVIVEYKYILPKIFDKLFDKIPTYVINLKKFDKLKTLEKHVMKANQKVNEKETQLESIKIKHEECLKQIAFKEEYLKFLNTDIKTKILTLSYNEDKEKNNVLEDMQDIDDPSKEKGKRLSKKVPNK